MKKLLFIIMVSILIISSRAIAGQVQSPNGVYDYDFQRYISDHDCYSDYHIMSVWETQAEALAEANDQDGVPGWDFTSNPDFPEWNSDCWGNYRLHYQYGNGCYNHYIYLYPKDEENICQGNDPDQDGIPNDQDPYPENNIEDCKYRIIYAAWDNSSNLKAYMIETNYGDSMWYGDTEWLQGYIDGSNEGSSRYYLEVGGKSYPYICTQLGNTGDDNYDNLTIAEGQSVNLGTDLNSNGEADVVASGIGSGVTNEGTETDSELLGKIVDNTATQIQNDQTMANRLLAIEKNTRNIGNNQTGSGQSTSISNPNVGDAVREALEESSNEIEQEYSEEIGDIEDFDPNTEMSESGYSGSDIPEKNAIGDIIDSFVNNNPISTLINQSGAEVTSQDCDFNVDLTVMGVEGNIEFSFCEYDDWLSLFGTLIYGFSCICAIVIIAKR